MVVDWSNRIISDLTVQFYTVHTRLVFKYFVPVLHQHDTLAELARICSTRGITAQYIGTVKQHLWVHLCSWQTESLQSAVLQTSLWNTYSTESDSEMKIKEHPFCRVNTDHELPTHSLSKHTMRHFRSNVSCVYTNGILTAEWKPSIAFLTLWQIRQTIATRIVHRELVYHCLAIEPDKQRRL